MFSQQKQITFLNNFEDYSDNFISLVNLGSSFRALFSVDKDVT